MVLISEYVTTANDDDSQLKLEEPFNFGNLEQEYKALRVIISCQQLIKVYKHQQRPQDFGNAADSSTHVSKIARFYELAARFSL
jgi:hypothetical protein